MSIRLHQLSVTLDDERRNQWYFKGTVQEGAQLKRAIDESVALVREKGHRLRELQEVQVIEVVAGHASSAQGLVEDVAAAHHTFHDLQQLEGKPLDDLNAVRQAAERLDEVVAKHEIPCIRVFEFIWKNGGGDDNAYGDSFYGLPKSASAEDKEIQSDFEHALRVWVQWQEEAGYDVGFTTEGDEEAQALDSPQAAAIALGERLDEAEGKDVAVWAKEWDRYLAQWAEASTMEGEQAPPKKRARRAR